MSCVLRINGENFQVNEFLNDTHLIPYEKHVKGEKHKLKEFIHKNSGCSFDLSNADFDRLDLQKKDTIEFLTRNFEKLKKLSDYGLTNEEFAEIDFAISTRMFDHDITVQTDFFEPEILRLAGELNFGIMISQYMPADE